MEFFYRHRTFSIFAAILLVLLILLFSSLGLKNNDGPLGSAARTIISGFQKPFAAMAGGLGNFFGVALSDDALNKENKNLKKQLEEAQSDLTIARLDREELEELKNLQKIFSGGAITENFEVMSANVYSLDASTVYNAFSIDLGSASGVKRNTVVLNGDGLIGRVVSSEKNSAKVIPILNENNKMGFQVKGADKNYLGVCQGDGKGYLVGNLLDENATIKVGDTVYTSGIGGIYPAGIMLGKIMEAEMTPDSPLMYIKIEPFVYFKGLKKVAVLL